MMTPYSAPTFLRIIILCHMALVHSCTHCDSHCTVYVFSSLYIALEVTYNRPWQQPALKLGVQGNTQCRLMDV